MIEQFYFYFILIGSTIGIVLLVLWHQARYVGRINLALIRLNEQQRYDTPAFLREAWALLSQAGMRGMEWKLDWFGVQVEGKSGKAEGKRVEREIHVSEMKLGITLYLSSKRGEQRYFKETLIETFLLLLRTDMLIKAGANDATFAQMSKLNLFLQHDMKNIAQYIQLMADQLAAVPPGKEQQVLDHLCATAPMIRHRADRIVRTLTARHAAQEPRRTVQLHHELAQLCRLYHLDFTISGAAEVRAPESALESALDNILKNYSDMHLRDRTVKPRVAIAIVDGVDAVEISITASNTPPATHVERLFEPFWSSDPAGLGIGLYQAKQMLELCGGTLNAQKTASGQLRFQIEIPGNKAGVRGDISTCK